MSRRFNNHCLDCGKEIDDHATYCRSCSKKGSNYKHGLTKLGKRNRRFNNHCFKCGQEIDDRATYCLSCSKKDKKHQQLHQLFGKNVTPEQLKWFFDNVK